MRNPNPTWNFKILLAHHSSIRTSSGSLSLHKVTHTSSSALQKERNKENDLHRWCSGDVTHLSTFSTTGILDQPGKICSVTSPVTRILGNDCRHYSDGIESTTRQSIKTSEGMPGYASETNHNSSSTTRNNWEDDSINISCLRSPTPLQISSGPCQQVSQTGNTSGQPHSALLGVQTGPPVVDTIPPSSKWEKTQKPIASGCSGNGCIKIQVGSCVLPQCCIREVVSRRSQLHITLLELRAARLALKTLCRRNRDTHILLKVDNQVEVRYINTKEELTSTKQGSNSDLDVVQAAEPNNSGGILTRSIERQSRFGVEKEVGVEQLEVESQSIQQNTGNQWNVGNWSVCSKTQHSAQEVSVGIQTQWLKKQILLITTGQWLWSWVMHSHHLVGRCLMKVITDNTLLTVTRLVNGSQGESTPTSTGGQTPTSWTVSHKHSVRKAFQMKLRNSCKHLGDQQHRSPMLQHGIATRCSWCNWRKTDPISAPVKYKLDFILYRRIPERETA